MNFRTTTLLFGILLGTLWIFGLILALGRSSLDPGFVLPKFAQGSKGEIASVEMVKNGKPYCVFTKTKDGWKLKVEGQAQEVRADEGEVEALIDEVRTARHSNEETDVALNRNLEHWGLNAPKTIVTIKNNEGETWTLRVGKEAEDLPYAFVNSSERQNEVLAVKRTSLSKVFVDDINKYRLRRLLSAKELATKRIDLKETKDAKVTELVLEKVRDKYWWFKKPDLGPADLEAKSSPSPSPKEEKKDKFDKGDLNLESSGRSMLAAITNLRVDDFEAIGSPMTIDEKNAILRIEVDFEPSEVGKDDKAKGALKKEVLLIGEKVRGDKEQYYARMADDNSVVRVSAKQLEPVFALIKDPSALRSRDVALLDPDAVDAVEIWRGSDFAKLYRVLSAWRVFSSEGAPKLGSDPAITGNAGLLPAIQGRGTISEKDFEDISTPEKLKAVEAKFADNKLDARVKVYIDSLLPEPEKKEEKKAEKPEDKKVDDKKVDDKKAEDKKADDKKGDDKKVDDKKADDNKVDDKKADDNKADDKKVDDKKAYDQKVDDKKADDKKADQKTDAKDDKKADQKDAEAKKDSKQDELTQPKFKEGAKPVVILSFVKLDKDKVLVKRELTIEETKDAKDNKEKKEEVLSAVTYFTLPTSNYDKIVPRDMALTYYDTNLKTFPFGDAIKLELSRAPAKDRDKLLETFLLERQIKEKEKAKDADKKDADKKDTDKKDAKDADKKDADKKDPEQKKDAEKKDADKKDAEQKKDAEPKSEWKLLEPKEFAGKGEIQTGEVNRVLEELADLRAVRWFGKATKAALEDRHLGDNQWAMRVVVTPKKKEGDKEEPKPFAIRLGDASNSESDKGAVFAYQEGTDYIFLVDSNVEKLLKDAEFRDRHVMKFETAKVKELRVFVTTSDKEVRKPVFERNADKTWKDKKEVLGFKIDSRRVDDLIDKLADLQVVRYLSAKGDPPKEYELGDAAPLKLEVMMDDDKTIHTVTVGAASEKNGPYYATCSAMPGQVFLLGRDPFSELMGKVTYFRKD